MANACLSKEHLNGAGRSPATGQFVAQDPLERRVAALRAAMLEAISPEDMASIARMLVMHASCGDLRAMRILFPYVLGKPAPIRRSAGPLQPPAGTAPFPAEDDRPAGTVGERKTLPATLTNRPTPTRKDPIAATIDAGCTLVASLEARERLEQEARLRKQCAVVPLNDPDRSRDDMK